MTSEPSRVAIVTGASRGLGLATSRALAGAGWSLVIDARNGDDLARAEAELSTSTTVTAVAGDVADPEHRRRLVGAAAALGRLDLLVNNASILGPSPQPRLAEYPIDVLRRVYEVNVLAPLALTQEAIPALRDGSGMVINVTSDAAIEGYEGWGGYGSAKAALNQISNVLAAEEPDISVYWLDPGDMNTRMHQEAFPGEDISDRPDPEKSVPALLALIESRPPSGHYRAEQLLAASR